MIFRRLREQGVLGINSRNAELIATYNSRHLYPLVDDKLRTKQLAREHGVPAPELYGSLSTIHDIHQFPEIVAGREQFVVKPANGSGGCLLYTSDAADDAMYV